MSQPHVYVPALTRRLPGVMAEGQSLGTRGLVNISPACGLSIAFLRRSFVVPGSSFGVLCPLS